MDTAMSRMLPPSRFLPLLVVALLLWTGCDSNDEGGFSEADLAGSTYDITEFVFETDGTGIADADILGALNANNSAVRFFSGGNFQIEYQFTGEGQRTIFGDYSVGGDEVDFNFDDSIADARRQLLLPDRLSFAIVNDAARLELEQRLSDIRLSDFSEEQFGNTRSDGTMIITLRR
jgi:hypothetical protein